MEEREASSDKHLCVPPTEGPLLRTSNLLSKFVSPTHCLCHDSQNKSSSSTVKTCGFHQELSRAHKEGKLQQKESISHPNTGFCMAFSVWNANSGSFYRFSMGKRTKETESLQGSWGATQRQIISSLSVIFFHSSKIN
jgi:hypothetical protein